MLKRLKLRHIIMTACLGMLFSFQNCSQPLAKNQEDMVNSAYANLPFAFKAQADTLAYMSCTRLPSSFDPSAYFTLRAGAYGSLGVALTQDFMNAVQYFPQELRAQAIGESTANMGASVQLSIRQYGKFQNVLTGQSGSVIPNQDIANFLMPLDQNPIVSQLAALRADGMNQGSVFDNHFDGSSFSYANQSGLMYQSLRFFQSEAMATSVREHLNGTISTDPQSIVTLTFSGGPGEHSARGPLGISPSSVYGTGYRTYFSPPSDGAYAGTDHRVLTQVQEFDLGGGHLVAPRSWNCPSSTSFSTQYIIVLPEDVQGWNPNGQNVGCWPMSADPTAADGLNANQLNELALLRRVLPQAHWYIDPYHRCIIPKGNAATTSCYGNRTGLPAIDYDGGCTAFNKTTNAIGNCPHWVSLCYRN